MLYSEQDKYQPQLAVSEIAMKSAVNPKKLPKKKGLSIGRLVETIKQPSRPGVILASVGHNVWLVRMDDNNEELNLTKNQIRSIGVQRFYRRLEW
jgi:hypothetical protein